MSDDATHLVRARQALRNAAAVVPHTDADGLAAGAIALRERGECADAAVLLEPGTTPWTPGTDLPEGPLAILDWGVRELDVDMDEVFPLLDTHVLFKLHWGGKGVKDEAWERLVQDDFKPRLERMWRDNDYLHQTAATVELGSGDAVDERPRLLLDARQMLIR